MSFKDFAVASYDQLLAVMGEDVIFRPITSEPDIPIKGVFRNQNHVISQNPGVYGNELSCGFKISSVFSILSREPQKGDLLIIRGTTYSIYDIEPDGEGWAEFGLHEDA
jgi:hypothetical protein